MSKGAKIFINILYYILTFGIGIVIAVSAPAAMNYTYSMKAIEDALEGGNYQDAMMSVGGYYEADYNYLSPNKDVVIFNTITMMYNSGDEEDTLVDGTKVHKSYCVFYFNVPSEYKTAGKIEENKTKVVITDIDDNQKPINNNLIDYDYDQDGTLDSISTLVSYNFIFFEIPIEDHNSVKKIEFYDVSGNVYYALDLETPLEFKEQFYTDVDAFVEEYNRDYTSAKLLELDEEFRAKSDKYLKSSNGDIVDTVKKKSTLYVILYFVAIYFIGDSLIGGRFIIKGIRFLWRKIFKRKQKEKDKPTPMKEFVGAVYCNLTIELDVLEDFDKSVTVSYSNENESFEFYLVKEDGYKKSKRVMAGVYMNFKLEVDSSYVGINPPETLELSKMNEKVIIKIRKKEGVN